MPTKRTKAPDPDPLLSSVMIGALLGVTSRYALMLIKRGEFGATYDVGNGLRKAQPRVHKSAVDAWLAARKVAS